MTTISELTKKVIDFRDRRNWKQFHNPKDVAISLMLEAAEVAEHFQWKNENEISEYIKDNGKDLIAEELSDVLYWVLLLFHDLDIDLDAAFTKKMKKNELKYPVDLAKGSNKKYTEL